jgi:hypothetical protein
MLWQESLYIERPPSVTAQDRFARVGFAVGNQCLRVMGILWSNQRCRAGTRSIMEWPTDRILETRGSIKGLDMSSFPLQGMEYRTGIRRRM